MKFLKHLQIAYQIAGTLLLAEALPVGGESDLPPLHSRVGKKKFQFDLHARRLE